METIKQKAVRAIEMVRTLPVLSYDTETSGLDWRVNFPVGYVIGSTAEDMVYIPVRHGGGGNLADMDMMALPTEPDGDWEVHWFEKELAAAFRYRTKNAVGPVIGHNLKFDCHFSANAGVMLGRDLVCSQNTECLIYEYANGFSLDSCSQRHGVTVKLGQPMYDHLSRTFGVPTTKKSMSEYWKLAGNDKMAVDYACGDGVSAIELYQKQKTKMVENELLTVYSLENRLIWTLFRMERRGVRLDMDYLSKLNGIIDAQLAEALECLPKGFNARSPLQVRAWCEKHGKTNWPKTVKGNPSFDEKFLNSFVEGQMVVRVRKWKHLSSSFVTPLVEEHEFKGRVHCNLNQLKGDDSGTVARLSCSRPNLQQIPKRNKEIAQLLRKVFIADEGMEFNEADFSQCEPRLFACYARDKNLLDGYCPPEGEEEVDVHDLVAAHYGIQRGAGSPGDPGAKTINMGMFNGMYQKTLALHLGCSLSEAHGHWDNWFRLFPGIKMFQEKAGRVLRERGYVTTKIGRRGHWQGKPRDNTGPSKIIQNGAADVMKWKLVEMDMYLESQGDLDHMLFSVHDSAVFQTRANAEGRAARAHLLVLMADVQSEPFNLIVPFKCDLDTGANWAEASFGKAAA